MSLRVPLAPAQDRVGSQWSGRFAGLHRVTESVFRVLPCGDVFDGAFVVQQRAGVIAHSPGVSRDPDGADVFAVRLNLETLYKVVPLEPPLQLDRPRLPPGPNRPRRMLHELIPGRLFRSPLPKPS